MAMLKMNFSSAKAHLEEQKEIIERQMEEKR